jgi:SAM-dependent methyltransferase
MAIFLIMEMNLKHNEIQAYYGKTLENSSDLKTNACCTLQAPPRHIQEVISEIHDEVKNKYYGCGLTIPFELEGLRILDIGSGSGRDCFIASKLVGENGEVIGVDMTDEQLEVANAYVDYHTEKFGYRKSNVKFVKGNIDNLDDLNLEKESFDLVISNCVINLSLDKKKLLESIYKLLKPGGEMYFSDVYSDRRIGIDLQNDPVLWGECLSGALYWNDLLKYSKSVGFTDPRVVENHPIGIENAEIEAKIGGIKFFSVTYRLFKINGLEEDCEDYGQAVRYKGSVIGQPHSYDLDDHHHFPKGKMMPVCGNTFRMLSDTRLAKHFECFGTWETHFGIFEGCGGNMPFTLDGVSRESCC